MRWLLLVVSAVLGLVIVLALAEGVMRIVRPQERRQHVVTDPLLHHRLRANFTGIVAGVPFQTNSLGLRDREYARPKPAGVFRILMLGDSFTEGGGLPLEDTVAKGVETRLGQRGCSAHEVVNAGVPSYSPILEYLLLKELGPQLGADLVVLNFDMTDVHDDFIRTVLARLDADGLPVAVPPDRRTEAALLMPPLLNPGVLPWLEPPAARLRRLVLYEMFVKSHLGRQLFGPVNMDPEHLEGRGLIGNLRYDRLAITRDGEFPDVERGWQITSRYIIGIRRLAASQGPPFALVVYPHAHQTSAAESPGGRRKFGIGPGLFASAAPFQRLEALGRQQNFPVINLQRLFQERSATAGPLFRDDDIHHTAAGARVFAEGVTAGLVASQLLPRCR